MALASLAMTGRGRAQPTPRSPLPVALEVTTVETCAATRFHSALETRVRRPLQLRASGAGVTLRVAIEIASADELQATATFTGASGKATRSIRGSCEDITSALALVATTWLEAEPDPDAANSSPAAPAPTAPASVATATLPSARAREGESLPSLPKPFAIGAHAITTMGLAGGPAAGGGISLAYTTGRYELRGGLRAAFGGETVDAEPARYVWITAAVDGCVHAPTGRVVSLAGCARVEPGFFHASFVGSDRPLPWLAAGGGLRLGASMGPARFEIEAFGAASVTGYRITRSDATLVPFRSVVPSFSAGIMVPF